MTEILDTPRAAHAAAPVVRTRPTPAVDRQAAQPSREFLTFRLGPEEYGLDILRVQEIRSYEAPTRLANAPAFLKGVINLRGVIVPIIDLRMAFGCAGAAYDAFTVVIVLNVRGRVIGAVVDSVSDVIELGGEHIRPAPQMTANHDTSYVTGIGTMPGAGQERLLILVDIESVLGNPAMGLVDPGD